MSGRCEFCLGPLPPPARTGGQRRKFCCDRHRIASWKMKRSEVKERKRERLASRLRRLNDA